MPLTPQEEQELAQLNAAAGSKLTPAEEAELAQLNSMASVQPQIEPQPQVPTSIPVSAEVQPLPTGPQMPTSMLQQTITPERFGEALKSGAIAGGAKAALELIDLAGPQPLKQEIQKAGVAEPTLVETAAQATKPIPVLSEAFGFQAQTPAEMGAEILGGMLTEIPAGIARGKEALKAAREAQKEALAIAQVESSLVKRGVEVAPPVSPSPKILNEASKEISASSKLKLRYEPKALDTVTFSAKETEAAKSLDTKINNIEKRITNINTELLSPDLVPERKIQLDRQLLKAEASKNQLIKNSQDTLESGAYKALKDAKKEFEGKTIQRAGKEIPAYRESISKSGVYVSPQEMEILQNRPIPLNKLETSSVSSVDAIRQWQKSDGFVVNGEGFRLNVQPMIDAATAREAAVVNETNAFRQVVKDLGIDKLNPQRREQLFNVADGVLTGAEINITNNEQKFLDYMAKKYNDWITEINQKLVKVGQDPIKTRKNYITHLRKVREFDNFGFGSEAIKAEEKLPKFAQRGRIKSFFEKARVGGEDFVKDPIQAFESYIDPAMKQINYIEPGAILEARLKHIGDFNLKEAQSRLIREAFWGGMDTKDQALIEAGLKPILTASEKLSGVVSRGVILGNVKTTASQFSQIAATAKEAGIVPALQGMGKIFEKIPKEIADASSFLTLRKVQEDLIPISSKILQKPANLATALFEFADKYVAKASWHAGFIKAQKLGLGLEASIKYADDVARMLHGNYNAIYKPALLRGKSGRAFLPLQTFAFNAWNHLARDPRVLAELKDTSRLRETLKILAAMYATNQVYTQLGVPNPFSISLPENLKPSELISSATEFALGNQPLLNYLIGKRTPGPLLETARQELDPRNSLLFNSYVSIFSDDLDKKEKAQKKLMEKGAKFVPGGLQAYRTITGIEAAKNGYVEYGGDYVMLDEKDKKLAPIFGPFGVPSVQKAMQEKQKERLKSTLGEE